MLAHIRALIGRRHMSGLIFGAGARVFSLASQIVVLVLMSRLLPKAEFGDLMVAFTAYRLLTFGLGSGLGSIVLFHVGRNSGDATLDVRLMRSVNVAGLIISFVLTVVALRLAPHISSFFAKPGLEKWLVSLAPLIVTGSMLQITTGSLDGKSQITRSILVSEFMPNMLRVTGFIILAVTSLGVGWIAPIIWISAGLPWLVDCIRLLNPAIRGFQKLTPWDLRYGSWLGIYPLLGQQLQGIDMLLVAKFFTSEVTAEYSIASRIASYFPFFVQILMRTAAPRIGALVQGNKSEQLNAELAELRSSSLQVTSGASAPILLLAPVLIHFSGDYYAAIPILLMLAVAPLIRTAFIGLEPVLRMRGQGAAIAIIAAASLAIIAAFTWGLHGPMGLACLPLSMTVSALVVNYVAASRLPSDGLIVYDLGQLASLAPACLGLAAVALLLPPIYAVIAGSLILLGVAATASGKFRWVVKKA